LELICVSYTSLKKNSVTGLQVTLLVATSVAEEGLDIRQCNVVIRFDLAKTVLAYIQSRGRARKPGSDYILMLER
jgi:endoribonuclease Dicer